MTSVSCFGDVTIYHRPYSLPHWHGDAEASARVGTKVSRGIASDSGFHLCRILTKLLQFPKRYDSCPWSSKQHGISRDSVFWKIIQIRESKITPKKRKKTVGMINTLDTPKIRPLSRPLCIPSNSQLFLDFFHIILTAKMWILVETIQLYPMKTTRILCALLVLPEMTLTFDFQAECHLLIYINYFCREISLIKTKLSLWDTPDQNSIFLFLTRLTHNFFFL